MAGSSSFFGKAASVKPSDEKDDVKHVVSPTWQQFSSNDDLENNYFGPTIPGYRTVYESIKFVNEWSEGDEGDQWSKNLISYDPVGFHVKTVHHGIGTSGKIRFHFEYDVQS
jgi:hypothetical protein